MPKPIFFRANVNSRAFSPKIVSKSETVLKEKRTAGIKDYNAVRLKEVERIKGRKSCLLTELAPMVCKLNKLGMQNPNGRSLPLTETSCYKVGLRRTFP